MQKNEIAPDLHLSRIIWGFWRLAEWKLTAQDLLHQVEEALDRGLTTLDHADIYGDYSCEQLFGKILKQKPALRSQMQLISKCGIKLLSKHHPERKVKHYDTRASHIIASAEQSLKNLHTDYLDVLLLHRPDPLMQPDEVARAFQQLKEEGKVRYFGVSNFTPSQQSMLQVYLPEKLVTNQLEFSPLQTAHIEDGTFDFLLQERCRPMIWSPLAGGALFQPETDQQKCVKETLKSLAKEMGIAAIDTLAYAWILKHPVGGLPVAGTGKLNRLQAAIDALEIELPQEAWFRIYEASRGHEVA